MSCWVHGLIGTHLNEFFVGEARVFKGEEGVFLGPAVRRDSVVGLVFGARVWVVCMVESSGGDFDEFYSKAGRFSAAGDISRTGFLTLLVRRSGVGDMQQGGVPSIL